MGRPAPSCLASYDLTSMVMGEPPNAGFTDEEIAGSEGAAAVEFLFAEHESGIAEEQHALVKAGDARSVGV